MRCGQLVGVLSWSLSTAEFEAARRRVFFWPSWSSVVDKKHPLVVVEPVCLVEIEHRGAPGVSDGSQAWLSSIGLHRLSAVRSGRAVYIEIFEDDSCKKTKSKGIKAFLYGSRFSPMVSVDGLVKDSASFDVVSASSTSSPRSVVVPTLKCVTTPWPQKHTHARPESRALS